MPVSRRLELIRYAAEHKSLIIEDDFENEFVYLQKPTPSLFSLSGGHDVVYIGSFFQASSALYPGKLYDTSPGTF